VELGRSRLGRGVANGPANGFWAGGEAGLGRAGRSALVGLVWLC
jgi:hypothetical protein